MQKINESSQTVAYLEKIYKQLNKDKFGGELEEPFITIQPTPKAYGHITTNRVWKTGEKERYEINLNAETLNRPIENTVATILHEMTHMYNIIHGIQDCSRGNTYHNKKFKEKAETVGLEIQYDKKIGWSITKPTEELIKYINAKKWDKIPIVRNSQINAGKSKTGTKSSTRKYICPACGMSVRATKEVYLICGNCKEKMKTEND